jgi:hypothetical protein
MLGAESLVAGIALAALPSMIALFYAFLRFEPGEEHVVEADGVSR